MLEDPRVWVSVAFLIFIALLGKKIFAFAAGALDGRSAKIAAELNEARRLREEAEAVLAGYKQRQSEYEKEAEAILQNAQRDAEHLRQFAEKDLKAAIETRTQNALDRIAREEASAVAEVRNHVVELALAAARSLIADQVELSQDEQVSLALADIERKIH